ncbi:MAG: hypothetical protein GX556_02445 [Fibrobacter sp.]|nr:hypothetical protein [Fibrobacter sp.]
MRVVALGVLTFFTVICFSSAISAGEKQYVDIKKPFANIYKELDPKSEIIEQAKKGDHLELVFEGTSWYHVKVKENSFGWVEKKAGEIVDNPGSVSVFSIILILLLVGGTAGGVFYYIKKNKVAEA